MVMAIQTYLCHMCYKRFLEKTDIIEHFKEKHTGEAWIDHFEGEHFEEVEI
jgi:hypothetical protein